MAKLPDTVLRFFKWLLSGSYHTADGYVRRRSVLFIDKLEHRQIAEEILGRRLERGEVVHHINGRRADNRPENLCVMPFRDHERYHGWYKWIFATYGNYPTRETQLRKLTEDFNGTLLGDYAAKNITKKSSY